MKKLKDSEKACIKRFLDRKWRTAEKDDSWDDYLYCMGWLYFNSFILSGMSPLQKAFESLETIKDKNPKLFETYLTTCIEAQEEELKKIEASNNLVAFPKTVTN